MKRLIILTLITILSLNVSFSSNKNSQSVQDDPSIMNMERTYSLSNDTVNAVLKVIQYSKGIIKYDISIVTSKSKIEQEGYALNLNSDINSGIENEQVGKDKEQRVVPYLSWLCGCGDMKDLEIRISIDKSKVSIFASRKLRHELFIDNDKIELNEKLEDSVPLILGYLNLQE